MQKQRRDASTHLLFEFVILVAIVQSSLSIANITAVEETESKNATEKPGPILTGIPQKDYIHDPNLPRELNGFDLSDYPFYKRVPNVKFNFSCDDRHDGFYASIPHKCQVYHNCLFGVRYDFLCANYTAFDQSNFICHFANEVDCENSELHYSRNDALYKEETTTTSTTAAPQVKIVYVERNPLRRRPGGTGGRRRKTTPKPAADEYYYDDYVDDKNSPPVKENVNDEYYYDDYDQASSATTTSTTTTTTTTSQPSLRKRRPNRPLRTRIEPHPAKPLEGVDYPQYDTPADQDRNQPIREQQGTQNQNQPKRKRRRRRKKTTTTTTTTTTTAKPDAEYYDEYYYDEYYDESSSSSTTTTTTEQPQIRRRPEKASHPSAHERRQALLQSRRSQDRRFVRQSHASSSPSGSNARRNRPADIQQDETYYTDYIT